MPFDAFPEYQPSPEVKLLRGAKRVIGDPDHWMKWCWHNDGRMCLVAALRMQSGTYGWMSRFIRLTGLEYRVLRAMRRQIPTWHRYFGITAVGCLVSFNDGRKTSHADIIALLDRTIEYFERHPAPLFRAIV